MVLRCAVDALSRSEAFCFAEKRHHGSTHYNNHTLILSHKCTTMQTPTPTLQHPHHPSVQVRNPLHALRAPPTPANPLRSRPWNLPWCRLGKREAFPIIRWFQRRWQSLCQKSAIYAKLLGLETQIDSANSSPLDLNLVLAAVASAWFPFQHFIGATQTLPLPLLSIWTIMKTRLREMYVSRIFHQNSHQIMKARLMNTFCIIYFISLEGKLK